jgi:hypothetical protein
MSRYKLRRIAVMNGAGLGELAGLIHDEEFEVADVVFDSNLGVVTIPFRRIFHGGPERVVRRTLFCVKKEVDIVRALICIKHVTAARTIDTEKIGTYTFESVAFDPAASQLVFRAGPKLELRFDVSCLQLEYEETQFAGKALITDGWFWQKSQVIST